MIVIRFFTTLIGFMLFVGAHSTGSLRAAPMQPSVDIFSVGPSSKAKKETNTHSSYISLGVKYIPFNNISLKDDPSSNGTPDGRLELKWDKEKFFFYQAALGTTTDDKYLRFRYDFEFYFGFHNADFTRIVAGAAPVSATGKFSMYGTNFNIYYDFPTVARFFTPYLGVSGMVLAVRLKGNNLDKLFSGQVRDLVKSGSGLSRSTNALFGYGVSTGFRGDIASWLAIDTGYRFIRFEGCLRNEGCNIVTQQNIHEARTDIVLRF